MSEQASKEGERQGLSTLPRPGSREDAHLTQSRRGKGTVLTGAGPSPVPREESEGLPKDSSLDSER